MGFEYVNRCKIDIMWDMLIFKISFEQHDPRKK